MVIVSSSHRAALPASFLILILSKQQKIMHMGEAEAKLQMVDL
jgi:hypothetical protein